MRSQTTPSLSFSNHPHSSWYFRLSQAPWWLISAFLHALLLALASFIVMLHQEQPPRTQIRVSLMEEVLQPFDPPEIPLPVTQTLKEIQDETEVPLPECEAEIADHEESESSEDFQESTMNSPVETAQAFEAQSLSTAIGLSGAPPGGFKGRFEKGGRRHLTQANGGDGGTEKAVEAGLRWLKEHQDPGGFWDGNRFMNHCKGTLCSGEGKEWTTVGQTGLALLAFLGAGNTNRQGAYKEQVRIGLKYLKEVQTPDGCFGSQDSGIHYMYNHTIAALAMSEAYEITQSALLKKTAQQGIDFLVTAQNPGLAWRYTAQSGDNDSSVSGWAIMALKSAKNAGLNVPFEAFEGAQNWLNAVTDTAYYRAGYMKRGDQGSRLVGLEGKYAFSEAMTAVGMASRIFMGEDPQKSPFLKGGANLLSQSLPLWDNAKGIESKIDCYYWYYGTLAMFQMDGEYWKIWNTKMKKALVESQKQKGCEAGSWDPLDPWGTEGGRVYTTAINILSLEIYYRYPRAFGRK
jgi:hypothetical protein